MKNLKSTNLQLIGFFGTKKPIICKIVDSVHSSVNFILETVPYTYITNYLFNPSLVRLWYPGNCSNHGDILKHLGGYEARIKAMENFKSVKKTTPLKTRVFIMV